MAHYSIREGLEVADDAWRMPFIGDTNDLLWQNLQNMDDARRREADGNDRYHMNHVSIIQSSGTGKSRLVDEVAKRTFTIPFSLKREYNAQNGGAWPPHDRSISHLMIFSTNTPESFVYHHYLCFFEATFKCVTAELELMCRSTKKHKDRQSLASAWRLHLEKNNGEARDALYAKIYEQANTSSNGMHVVPKNKQEALTDEMANKAWVALDTLITRVKKHSSSPQNSTELTVLMYFDRVYALDSKDQKFPDLHNNNVPSKRLLDTLTKSLNTFQSLSFFTIFLSTQLILKQFTPASQYPQSEQCHEGIKGEHAPITETPFDCFGDRPLVPSRLIAGDLHDVVFLGLFGRPLWRSMLHEFTEEVMARVTAPSTSSKDQMNVDPVVPVDSYSRSLQCSDVLSFARSKLLRQNHVSDRQQDSPLAAQGAVLDVRIMLSYETSRKSTRLHVTELVNSHMRTIFSVPQRQESFESGYPSEPILAEAAAYQLYRWRSHEKHKVEPALQIISDHLDLNLLSCEDIAEVVGRMLLMLAHDRASVKNGSSRIPKFSKAVPLTRFIEKLFPKEYAEQVLNSHPDNQVNNEKQPTATLREVFKDAVINFTHFVNYADEMATSQEAALASFIRHMAHICRYKQQAVDVAIPVLLRSTDTLSPEAMTMILVRFKFRASVGDCVLNDIFQEDVGLFPADVIAGGLEPRPYIMLTMELGVQPSLPSHTEIPTNSPLKIEKRHHKVAKLAIAQAASARCLVEPLYIPSPHTQNKWNHKHPRYSIYAYGCSPETYKVIKEVDRNTYQTVLQRSHLLADHPRLDPDSLKAVQNQKPFFSAETPPAN